MEWLFAVLHFFFTAILFVGAFVLPLMLFYSSSSMRVDGLPRLFLLSPSKQGGSR